MSRGMIGLQAAAAGVAAAVVLGAPCAVAGDVVLGVAAPAGGPRAGLGRSIREAASRWAAAGPGRRLVTVDDACSARGGLAAAAALALERPQLVIGHPCANAALAAAPAYASAGIPLVVVGATAGAIGAPGAALWRLGPRDDAQAAATVHALLALRRPDERIAVVHDRTLYARTLAEAVALGLAKAGLTGVVRGTVVAGEKDYNALVADLSAAGATLVYFAGFRTEARIIAATAGARFDLLGSDAVAATAPVPADDQDSPNVPVPPPADEPGLLSIAPVMPDDADIEALLASWAASGEAASTTRGFGREPDLPRRAPAAPDGVALGLSGAATWFQVRGKRR